jgi:hypothetical protein
VDRAITRQCACDANDVSWYKVRQAIRRNRRRWRQQIQQRLLGFAGGFLFALAIPAAEPVPFSHRQHAPLKLACAQCHTTVKSAERAGFPEAQQCMICHRAVKADSPAILRLAAMPRDEKLTPAVRVYKLPDFVFFSHGRHAKAGTACETCHGPVMEKDIVEREVTPNMKFCVDCHKVKSATVTCNACHELNQ